MMLRMMVVFEVHLAPDADPASLLSADALRDTQAQVMTLDEARAVGFHGIPEARGREVRLIVVPKRNASWIARALETSESVGSFQVHDID